MPAVFPLFYAGNLEYYSKLLQHQSVIDVGEYFQKQTYRNRCVIATANGLQTLTIPVVREHKKTSINEVKISYAEKWQQIHWRALTSAYKNSPYFEFYEHHFETLYQHPPETLVAFTKTIFTKIQLILKQDNTISFSENFIENAEIDFRNAFAKRSETKPTSSYQQVFSDRFGFQSNLSIFDLIFNCGPNSAQYLKF
jgi:hypothetical protein